MLWPHHVRLNGSCEYRSPNLSPLLSMFNFITVELTSYLTCTLLSRYFYIVHAERLHTKFPDPKVLTTITIVSVLSIFAISCFAMLQTLMFYGWPQVKMYHITTSHKIICVGTILSIYVLMLSLSCFFYILVLRKRGQGPILQSFFVLTNGTVNSTKRLGTNKERVQIMRLDNYHL